MKLWNENEARLANMIADSKESEGLVYITETMTASEHCMPCTENWPMSKMEEVYTKEYKTNDTRTLCWCRDFKFTDKW